MLSTFTCVIIMKITKYYEIFLLLILIFIR